MSLMLSKPAPDFELPAVIGGEIKTIKLSDYRGRWVILFTWPADFTGVCASEIPEFNRRLKDFEALNTAVIGFNNDSVHSHKRWAVELGGVDFPLAADKTNRVCQEYGVLLEDGLAIRATWIIDPEGIVRWSQMNWRPIGRDLDGIVRELKALQSGGVCMANWKPQN